MDLDEINRHRRAMGLPEHEASCEYPSSFRKDDPSRESLWTVTATFIARYKHDADKRVEHYNRALRNNKNDYSLTRIPGRDTLAGSMYEAWFLVPASKLKSFEEMLRLDIIKEYGQGGLYAYKVSLFATV